LPRSGAEAEAERGRVWQKGTGIAGRVGFCQRGASETGEKGLGGFNVGGFFYKEKER